MCWDLAYKISSWQSQLEPAHVHLMCHLFCGFRRRTPPICMLVTKISIGLPIAFNLTADHTNCTLPCFCYPCFSFILKTKKLGMAPQASSTAIVILLVLFIDMLHLQGTLSGYGGWQSGHATFYGGGDASGTMGEFIFILIFTRTKISNLVHDIILYFHFNP